MRAAILIAVFAGCTGTIGEDETSESTSEGQQMFASTVNPILRSCAGCHEGTGSGPAFLGASGPRDDYAALRANARVVGGFEGSSALLLTKGSHSGATWWTSSQTSTITAWLAIEKAGQDASGAGRDVMAAWVGCMTLENWDDSQMGMWADKQTDQGATCGGCHADGEYGFHASPTREVMFAQQRTARGVGSFFQVSAATATPSVVPAIDKLRNKCAGGNLHPACAVDDQYVEYLERYTALTNAMMNAGLCGAPGYKTLTDPL